MNSVCAVTGASGYLGSVVARYFLKRGWSVRGLTRRGAGISDPAYSEHPYDLRSIPDAASLRGASVLIHCAYDFSGFSWPEIKKSNIDGSLALFEAARASGVERTFFISSISAFEGAVSMYGKAKLEVEKQARPLLAGIIRPGLVFGATGGGTFGRLAKLASTAPVLPLIGGGRQPLYLVHEDDAARVIFECSISPASFSEPMTVAHPQPRTFREVLEIAALKAGRRARFVPVPFMPMLAALKLAEGVGLRPRLRSDSLISLFNPNPNVDFAPLKKLGVELRPYSVETLP